MVKVMNLKKQVRIALVGKYVELPDAYFSEAAHENETTLAALVVTVVYNR